MRGPAANGAVNASSNAAMRCMRSVCVPFGLFRVGRGGLRRAFGGFEFGEVFLRVAQENAQAAPAAESDELVGIPIAYVDEVDGRAHAAEEFAGDESGLQRVGLGRGRGFLGVGFGKDGSGCDEESGE